MKIFLIPRTDIVLIQNPPLETWEIFLIRTLNDVRWHTCRVCHILHAPWFIRIDFNKVPPSQTISYPKQNSINARGEVLQTSVLGLRRIISKEDVRLHDHRMTIKCVASIYEIYYKHVEITATLKPRRKHKRRRNEKMVINQEEGSHQEGEITS